MAPVGLPMLLSLLALGMSCAKASFVPVDDASADTREIQDSRDASAPSDIGDATSVELRSDARSTCTTPSVPGCTSSGTGDCDPVCQTGSCDWCVQKCSYVHAPSGSVPGCTSTGSGTYPQSCVVTAAGTPQQSDDCAPGSICLTPMIGDNRAYCFSLCRSQSDCASGVACGERKLSAAGGLVAVCDPPYDQCGEDGTCCAPLTNSGCGPDRVCLLVSPDLGSGHSRTVCEFSYGDGRNGSPCASARDCQISHSCVNNVCQQVCSKATTCSTGAACILQGSEFGYCP